VELEAELRDRREARERKDRKTTVYVTSGALTLILLAAAMVTVTFLMSPVIEELFGNSPSAPPLSVQFSVCPVLGYGV
jgi:hypothetical protein